MKIELTQIPFYMRHMCALTGAKIDGYGHYEVYAIHAELYPKLRRLEARALRITTRFCNGVSEEQEIRDEKTRRRIVKKVEELVPLLAGKVFVNYDARGYALKVKEKDALPGMFKDWGSYGIVAPEF